MWKSCNINLPAYLTPYGDLLFCESSQTQDFRSGVKGFLAKQMPIYEGKWDLIQYPSSMVTYSLSGKQYFSNMFEWNSPTGEKFVMEFLKAFTCL